MTTFDTHVDALVTERMRLHKQLNARLDDYAQKFPGQPLNAEETTAQDAINADIDAISATITRYTSQEERERKDGEFREAHASVFGPAPMERSVETEAKQLRDWLTNKNSDELSVDIYAAAAHAERLRDTRDVADIRNVLLSDTGSAGSLVPTTLATTLYEYLEASVAMFRAPTTKFTTSSGETLQIPKLAAHTIGTQVIAQGTAIGGTDPTFARLQLDAFKYGALVLLANEFIQDSAVDIVSWLGKDMGRALGRVIATPLVTGSGSGGPRGIVEAQAGAGTITTGGSLIPIAYEDLVDVVYSIPDEYLQLGSGAWLMKNAVAGDLRKLRDGAGGTIGAVLWEPSLTAGIQNGQPDRLLGYPVYTDPAMAAQGSAAKSVVFGDFSSYYIRQVGSISLERSDHYAFNVDESAFRATWRVDGDCIDPTTGGNVGAVNLIRQVP